jgi:hypothetical protein
MKDRSKKGAARRRQLLRQYTARHARPKQPDFTGLLTGGLVFNPTLPVMPLVNAEADPFAYSDPPDRPPPRPATVNVGRRRAKLKALFGLRA